MSSKTLTLPLKAEYFNAIKSGEKVEEYRLCTPYWQRRLYSPFGSYDQIVVTLAIRAVTTNPGAWSALGRASRSRPSNIRTLARHTSRFTPSV